MEAPRAFSAGGARGGSARCRPSTAPRPGRLNAPAAASAGRRSSIGRRPPLLPTRAVPPDAAQHAADLLAALPDVLAHAATLAYEPVAAPCSLMNCGDVVHRR